LDPKRTGITLSPTQRGEIKVHPILEESFPPKSAKQFAILVVEGNPAEVLLISEAFKASGITTGLFVIKDLDDALAYLRREGKYKKVKIPDLIFLDLSFRETEGLAVLKEIKSTEALVHIPIVVAAGSDDPELVRAVYSLNGNAFIRKPNELNELLRFVKTCYQFWGSVVTLAAAKGR
jgi:CheY-like chemotaxis protein